MADHYPNDPGAKGPDGTSQDTAAANTLVEQLCRARQWAWAVHEHRVPGAARDLAWTLIGLTRDHDSDTYSPWSRVGALEPAQLIQALDLATDIARLIRKADALQPNLVRDGETGR